MAKFLTTRQTTSELENIITPARIQFVLISPYIKIADNLFPSLKLADQKNVHITLIYGKQELDNNVRKQLSQLNHLKLRFLEKLHAKCYYNETKMIISSLNLYDFSEGNFEMGILIDAQYDFDIYTAAKDHAELIITTSRALEPERQSLKDSIKAHVPPPKSPPSANDGYCIRGGENISFDATHPFCIDHYRVWDKDPEHKEHYCHLCGERHQTSFNKPLCLSCFKKSKS